MARYLPELFFTCCPLPVSEGVRAGVLVCSGCVEKLDIGETQVTKNSFFHC